MSANAVSWQSAFWALVPIALNSMTQPAGNVFAFPSVDQGFGMCSSPLVCACDALHFLVHFIGHTISTRSLREAMRLTLKPRFQNWNTGKGGSAAILRRNIIFRFSLFTLGALPQIIKLLCMQGIPVTTIIASLYFGSFLVLEIAVYFSSRLGRDLEVDSQGDDSVRSGDTLKKGVGWNLRVGVIALSDNIMFFPLVLSAYEIAKTIGPRPWPCAVGLCILAITPGIDTLWLKGEKVTLTQALMLFPNQIGYFSSSCLLLSISDRARSTDSRTMHGLWVCVGLFVIMGIGINSTYWLKMMSKLDVQSKEIESLMSFFWVIYYLGTALLYYSFRYDSSGTFKPLWANQLG